MQNEKLSLQERHSQTTKLNRRKIANLQRTLSDTKEKLEKVTEAASRPESNPDTHKSSRLLKQWTSLKKRNDETLSKLETITSQYQHLKTEKQSLIETVTKLESKLAKHSKTDKNTSENCDKCLKLKEEICELNKVEFAH